MPRVSLPQDFESYLNDTITQGSSPIAVSGNGAISIRGPNGRDQAIVYIGAIFDGYQYYENFTSALPGVTINFYKTFISQLSTPSTTSSTTTTTTTSTPSRPSCNYSILYVLRSWWRLFVFTTCSFLWCSPKDRFCSEGFVWISVKCDVLNVSGINRKNVVKDIIMFFCLFIFRKDVGRFGSWV